MLKMENNMSISLGFIIICTFFKYSICNSICCIHKKE
jgi:hypothetical protein